MAALSIPSGGKPHIRFETRTEEDPFQTQALGRKVYVDVDWVIVTPRGAKDALESKAVEWLNNKRGSAQSGHYDMEWVDTFERMYAMYKEGKEIPVDGTPLKILCSLFSPAEIENCKAANIYSLEQLADANEESLSRIGMGARDLKRRASESVKASSLGAGKISELEEENKSLKDAVEALKDIVAELQAKMSVGEDVPQASNPGRKPGRKPGRPAKE